MKMREIYKKEGYQPQNLYPPREITPEDINNGGVKAVIYANWNNDWALKEVNINKKDLYTNKEVSEETDKRVSFPSKIEHAIEWGRNTTYKLPMFIGINFNYNGKHDLERNHKDVLNGTCFVQFIK